MVAHCLDAEHSKLAAQSYLSTYHVVPVLLLRCNEPEEPSNNGGSSNNNSNQSSSQAQDFDVFLIETQYL